MHLKHGFADVNGTRLYYEMAGSGPALVLIHGHTLDTRMWDDQFEPLARDYRVIRYDMRGYGKSALPGPESYSPADDLMALLRHLGRDLLISLACRGVGPWPSTLLSNFQRQRLR